MQRPDACALIAVAIVQCELARIFKIQRLLTVKPYGTKGSAFAFSEPRVKWTAEMEKYIRLEAQSRKAK